MKIPDIASATKLAALQDDIIACPNMRPGPASKFIEDLAEFEPFLKATAQVSLSNLHVRQHFLLSALIFASLECRQDNSPSMSRKYPSIVKQAYRRGMDAFRELCTSGPLYAEGASYYGYCCQAFEFHARVTGIRVQADLDYLEAVCSLFEAVAAPDGFVPVTESRSTNLVPLERRRLTDGGVQTPTLTVIRRAPDYGREGVSHLCIHHDVRQGEFRRNLHVQPMFGHFSFYRANKWEVLPPVYTGWPADQKAAAARIADESNRLNVPRGPWNSPLWRAAAPKLRVLEASSSLVRLVMGAPIIGTPSVTRTFEIDATGFLVTDEGWGTTTLNLNADAGRVSFVAGDWSGEAAGTSELGPCVAPFTGTGRRRSVRFRF